MPTDQELADTLTHWPEQLPNPYAAVGSQFMVNALKGAGNMLTYPGRAMQEGVTTESAIPWGANVAMSGMAGGSMLPMEANSLRALSLRRSVPPEDMFGRPIDANAPGAQHYFDIMHDSGNKVGEAQVDIGDNPSELFLSNIQSGSKRGPNSLGIKEMRSLINSLKNEFPNAKTLTGLDRNSGAANGPAGSGLGYGYAPLTLRK